METSLPPSGARLEDTPPANREERPASAYWKFDSVAVGDFDGDGKLDLAAANYDPNDVSVLINDTPTAP